MSAPERIGIYGGTFSPPHCGHVRAAEAFAASGCIDRLMIIPSFLPPHKDYRPEVSTEDRLHMCEIAFSGIPGAEISDIEIRRGGKSYTVDTLRALSAPDRELVMLCGTDMLMTLDSWYRADEIFRLCTVAYVRRENSAEVLPLLRARADLYREKYGARIIEIESDALEISSTEIRRELSHNVAPSLIPRGVYEYIQKRGLYR